jgi:4-hydroxybenzoate polyprenyltransferase
MTKIRSLWRLMRPHQWIKNVFVFTGLIFGHYWTDVDFLQRALFAALAFSLLSSSIYVINDLLDRESDRLHPVKKSRPIAAGLVNTTEAIILFVALFTISLFMGWLLSGRAFAVLVAYGLMNIAYSFRLKHVVLLDVFCIATGFMLRIMIGTWGLGIPPSKWLLLCGLMVTLFLGFAKRRAEIFVLQDDKEGHRKVLKNYSSGMLDEFSSICASGVIISYSLYTMSPTTIFSHGTDDLIATVPFLVYGLFRYTYLLHSGFGGGDPSKDLFRDRHILGAVIGWALATIYFLMWHGKMGY